MHVHNSHEASKDGIRKIRDNQIGTGMRMVFFLIGTGMLTTQISAEEVSKTQTRPGVVTELPSEVSTPLDKAAKEAIERSPMSKRTVVRVRHVKLDVDAILNQESISVNFFPNVPLDIVRDKLTQTTGKTTSWVGHVGTNKINRAIFTIKDGKIVGTVHNGIFVYQIRPAGGLTGGIHAIYEIDQTKFPSERDDGPPPISPQPSSGPLIPHAPPGIHTDSSGEITIMLPPSSPPTRIDLMVAYGDDVKSAASAMGANIDTDILHAVHVTNQTFQDTRINLFLCLVDRVYVPGYSGSGSVEEDFNCLAFGLCSSSSSSASSSSIRGMRDKKQIDLVSVWVENGEDCGWAHPNDGTPMEPTLGYSVVRRTEPESCPTSNYSMAHELGHSMGTRHDRTDEGVLNTDNDKQNYGHFHTWINSEAGERTIMTPQRSCPRCARIPYWSNLNTTLSYSDGTTPMGVDIEVDSSNAANNAGALEANKNTVAGWKIRPTISCINAPLEVSPGP